MQVKSFAIWANAEKKQVPALVQSTLKWANENNLKVHRKALCYLGLARLLFQ